MTTRHAKSNFLSLMIGLGLALGIGPGRAAGQVLVGPDGRVKMDVTKDSPMTKPDDPVREIFRDSAGQGRLQAVRGPLGTQPAGAPDPGRSGLAAPVPGTQPALLSEVRLDPDEIELNKLIDQMASRNFRDRTTATEKLKALGPSVVPLLRPYREHVDPEVRMRVNEIITAWQWMRRGALVRPGMVQTRLDTNQHPDYKEIVADLKAKDFTLRSGDVVVKADDHEVPDENFPLDHPFETIYVLRDGKLIEMKMRGVVFSAVNTCSWDIEKGGNDHYRGVRDLRQKRYPEALARLKSAAAQGMSDPWTLGIIGVLSMRNGDRAVAREYYAKWRAGRPVDPNSPRFYEQRGLLDNREVFGDLIDTEMYCYVAWLSDLLARKDCPAAVKLWSATYLLKEGRNTELARRSAVADPPDFKALPVTLTEREQMYSESSPDGLRSIYGAFQIMLQLFVENQPAMAERYFRKGYARGFHQERGLCLLRLGKTADLLPIAQDIEGSSKEYKLLNEIQIISFGNILSGCLAAGDTRTAGAMFAGLERMGPDKFECVLEASDHCGLDQRPYAERMARRLADYLKEHPDLRHASRLLAQLDALLPLDPPVDFERAVKTTEGYDLPLALYCRAVRLMRTGQPQAVTAMWNAALEPQAENATKSLEAAKEAHAKAKKAYEEISKAGIVGEKTGEANDAEHETWMAQQAAVERLKKVKQAQQMPPLLAEAVALLTANGARLQADWAPLKGTIAVNKAADGGQFALKNTGEIFYIDAAGQLHPTTGLDPDLLPFPPYGDQIFCQPAGTIYRHRCQCYLFEKDKLRWVPSYLSPATSFLQLGVKEYLHGIRGYLGEPFCTPLAPTVLRHVIDHYPVQGYGRQLAWWGDYRGSYQVWGLWQDIVLVADTRKNLLIDASAEIARQLKRDRPVRVYRPIYQDGKNWLMLPAEAGLWILEPTGEIRRANLPIPSQDVKIANMDTPKEERSLRRYLGVAPQDGGQVLQLDLKTWQFELTANRYNGQGPRDWWDADPLPITFAFAREQLGRQRRANNSPATAADR